MRMLPRWTLNETEQRQYINLLAGELAPLRAKLAITQSELAYLIGISRQTYSSIESGRRSMSWSTYLALLLFFDYNLATHQMLRNSGIFPDALVERFNEGRREMTGSLASFELRAGRENEMMLNALDERGVQSLKTMLLVEYARCTGATGKMMTVLKS